MMLPPWWGDSRRRNNRDSAQQERRQAKSVGGRVQPGSGNSWRAKGDVKSEEKVTELKFTRQKSFTITMEIISKILKAAAQAGRDPELIIDFESHGVRAVINFEDIP